MREASRYEQHDSVVGRKLYAHMSAESGRFSPEVDYHIDYPSLADTYEFGLCVFSCLEMQTPNDTSG